MIFDIDHAAFECRPADACPREQTAETGICASRVSWLGHTMPRYTSALRLRKKRTKSKCNRNWKRCEFMSLALTAELQLIWDCCWKIGGGFSVKTDYRRNAFGIKRHFLICFYCLIGFPAERHQYNFLARAQKDVPRVETKLKRGLGAGDFEKFEPYFLNLAVHIENQLAPITVVFIRGVLQDIQASLSIQPRYPMDDMATCIHLCTHIYSPFEVFHPHIQLWFLLL